MIKKLLKRLIYGYKYNSDTYIDWLKSQGVKIGTHVTIYSTKNCTIDITRPWLLQIGDNVEITEGVTILTHGYDWSVLKGVYGDVLGSAGRVKIGNNVFIGVHSTILKGVTIGNNVIIGANSLVNKDIPDNVVAAGNPCKIIMKLEDYYKKRKQAQLTEATQLVQYYRERYNKEPDEKALHEFFWLFSDGNDQLCDTFCHMMRLGGTEKKSYEALNNNKKQFQSLKDFLDQIK